MLQDVNIAQLYETVYFMNICRVEEYWDPFFPELDQIVVKRKLPMIHIFLSVDPLDSKEDG